MMSSVARRRALPESAGPWWERSSGSPNLHRDAVREGGQLGADGHDLVGADESDRHHRRSGLQREEGDTGAALVEAPVERARALRVERDGAALFEEHALLVEGVQCRLAGTALHRHRADRREELAGRPSP